MEIARRDEFARLWVRELTEVIAAIENMSVGAAKKDGAEEIARPEQLSAVVRERLQEIARLTD